MSAWTRYGGLFTVLIIRSEVSACRARSASQVVSDPRRSKDLALVGMQDEIEKSIMTIQRFQTGLEVGSVSATVKELNKSKASEQTQDKKPLSYAEAARRGGSVQGPPAPRPAAAWS